MSSNSINSQKKLCALNRVVYIIIESRKTCDVYSHRAIDVENKCCLPRIPHVVILASRESSINLQGPLKMIGFVSCSVKTTALTDILAAERFKEKSSYFKGDTYTDLVLVC